ncbi:MAG: phage integrase N-terminal SAM-like domain-containing protein [Treponema sp.]|nr:phage integrase N-terminal SAM-like domain-containing protein [Treponema sp.]
MPPPSDLSGECNEKQAALPPETKDGFALCWEEQLERELRARKYSPKTIRTYLLYNRTFCRKTQKTPELMTSEDIKAYLSYLDKTLDRSASTMNMAISAFKFFYREVLHYCPGSASAS